LALRVEWTAEQEPVIFNSSATAIVDSGDGNVDHYPRILWRSVSKFGSDVSSFRIEVRLLE
jgi:hypothetical protein